MSPRCPQPGRPGHQRCLESHVIELGMYPETHALEPVMGNSFSSRTYLKMHIARDHVRRVGPVAAGVEEVGLEGLRGRWAEAGVDGAPGLDPVVRQGLVVLLQVRALEEQVQPLRLQVADHLGQPKERKTKTEAR